MHYMNIVLENLSTAFQTVGHKMNMDKLQVMSNAHVVPAPVKVGNVRLEVVDHYLRQTLQLSSTNSLTMRT